MKTTVRGKARPAGNARAGAPVSRTLSSDSQLLQDYLQSAGILVSTDGNTAAKVAPFQNAEGQAEAIVIDQAGSVYHVCREPLSDSGWNMYGIGAGFQSIAAFDAATLWAVGNDGGLWRSDHGRWTLTQAMPSGQLTVAASVGSDGTVWAIDANQTLFAKGPAATPTAPDVSASVPPILTVDASGRLNFFCVDTSGALWTTAQGAPGAGWRAWTCLGTPPSATAPPSVTRLALGANQDGRLQLFVVGSDANLYTLWQKSSEGPWSAWGTLAASSPQVCALAVGQNEDGRLEVFAVADPQSGGGSGVVSHIWQTAPNNGWSNWADMALPQGDLASDLAVVLDATGCLQIIAVGIQPPAGVETEPGAFWSKQTAPGQGWTAWQPVGSPPSSSSGPSLPLTSPILVQNADGHLEALALDAESTLWHLWQESGAWVETWASLGGVSRTLAVGRNQDGRIEVFAQGSDGALWHLWQTSPNNGWSDWQSLQTPPSDTVTNVAVVLDQTGALEVIAVGASNASWYLSQYGPTKTEWTGWMGQWWCWYPILGAPQFKAPPAGQNGDCWAIESPGGLVHGQGTAWSATPLPGSPPPAPACLAVDGEGAVWVLAADGTFFHYADGTFQQLPAGLPGAISLGASAASTIWATASAGQGQYALFAYRHGAWQATMSPPLGDINWNNFPQVSVGVDGTVWLLDGTGNAFRQTMSPPRWSWSAEPAATGPATLVHLAAGRGGSAWAVDSAGVIWQFNGSWSQFRHPLPGGSAPQVSPGRPGTLWAIDTSGNAYSYASATTSWQSAQGDFSGPLVQAPTSWAIGAQALYHDVLLSWSQSSVWECTNTWSTWAQGTAAQLSVGTDGSPWILDTEGRLWDCSGTPSVVPGTPPGLVQVAVGDATLMWAITRQAGGGAYALHLYSEGAWREVETSTPLFSGSLIDPVLSSAGDGTVWLLDTSGIPHRLAWTPRQVPWSPRSSTVTFQSVAAANTSLGTPATAHLQEGWAVDAQGNFRRSFGNGWLDAHTSLPGGALPGQISVGADGSIWALDTTGGLYRQRTWNQTPNPEPVSWPPAVGQGSPLAAGQGDGGLLTLFCLAASGQAWVSVKQAGVNTWAPWTPLPGPERFVGLTAALDQNGTLNVIALSSIGSAYVAAQSGLAWGAWVPLGATGSGVALASITAGRDASNLLHVFGLGLDGSAWVTQPQGSSNGWSEWTAMPSPAPATLVALVAGRDQDGILEVFAWDTAGVARHSWQDAQAPGGWSEWWPLGTTGQPPGTVGLAHLAAGNEQGGLLVVLAAGGDGAVYATHQAPTSTGWSDWTSLGSIGGVEPLGLALGTGPHGPLTAFIQGSDGEIYSAHLEPGSATGWSPIAPVATMGTAGAALSHPCAGAGEDGVLRVFAVGSGSVWHSRQQVPAAPGWPDWSRLSGAQPWQPLGPHDFAQMPVGSAAALWAVCADGSVQTSADGGSTWTPVAFPSANAPAAALAVSVGLDGTVWAVTATACYRYTGGTWELAGAGNFAQAPVGILGDLWAVDPDGAIWRSTDGGAIWWEDASYPGTARQLSMCADGSLWALDQDGTTSLAAAWQRIMRPTGMAGYAQSVSAAEVVAGQDEYGTRYLFFVAPENGNLFYAYELFHHAWSEPTSLTTSPEQVSNVGLTNQQDTGELIVYAAPTQGAIYLAQKTPGQRYAFTLGPAVPATTVVHVWPIPIPIVAPVKSRILELSAVDARHWYWFSSMAADSSSQDSALLAQVTGASPPEILFPKVIDRGGATPAVVGILRLPWPRPAAAPFCAALDKAGQIYMVSSFKFPQRPVNPTSLLPAFARLSRRPLHDGAHLEAGGDLMSAVLRMAVTFLSGLDLDARGAY